MLSFTQILKHAAQIGASDAHLVISRPPIFRIDGILTLLKEEEPLSKEDIKHMAFSVLNDHQRRILAAERDVDFSYDLEPNRFRINIHWEQGRLSVAARVIPLTVPSMESIGLDEIAYRFTHLNEGLILVTGPTGCGKSTTLAAMIERINLERNVNIITLEDPIEFDLKSNQSIVRQREFGRDFLSFKSALKHIVRQDPDVILVGEMRDIDTMQATVTLAETGHLVFTTLHTASAPGSLSRIVDIFPPNQQLQIRLQLANTLRAIITQKLIPGAKGGRLAVREILVNTPAVANLIRQNDIPQIVSVMQTSKELGMCTMNQDLEKLKNEGKITPEVGKHYSIDPKTMASYY